jgi:acetyl-CoA carboxylase biotin carboxyl carrier protein
MRSPMVGTFYARPRPAPRRSSSWASSVKAGDVICIIEAMKMINQIESDDGVIREILVEDGQPVEFDEPLYVIG